MQIFVLLQELPPRPFIVSDMLSPHEIAALLLLGDAQDIDDLEPEQLDGLLVHKLVTMEHGHGSGNAHPRLTSQGASMLEALRRIS
ncbi:hypothetical protein [Cupriavidus lacunae]